MLNGSLTKLLMRYTFNSCVLPQLHNAFLLNPHEQAYAAADVLTAKTTIDL